MDKDIKTLLLEAAESNDKMRQDEAFKLALVDLVTKHTTLFTSTRKEMNVMSEKLIEFNQAFMSWRDLFLRYEIYLAVITIVLILVVLFK